MPEPRRSSAWRPLLRALHRDAGYLAVGLTIVYALSGLAVNHIVHWDPSFAHYRRVHPVTLPVDLEPEALAREALAALNVRGPTREIYALGPGEVQILLDNRSLFVNAVAGEVIDEGQRPRFFLRAANWLHLNRGKKAWTVVADLYAVGLLFLAVSGMFMLPGRRGLLGRGGLLVLLGAAIPILYVALSGGPAGEERGPAASPPAAGASHGPDAGARP